MGLRSAKDMAWLHRKYRRICAGLLKSSAERSRLNTGSRFVGDGVERSGGARNRSKGMPAIARRESRKRVERHMMINATRPTVNAMIPPREAEKIMART